MLSKRVVKLQCGGTVEVSGDFDLFALTELDRTLIGNLTDVMSEYEAEAHAGQGGGE